MHNLSNPAPILRPHGGVITNLRNHFLIATAGLNDSVFERTVVYICTHDNTGAMGMVVNRPMENVSFIDIADSMGVKPLIAKKPTIYKGGPVETNRGFVIHTPEYTQKGSVAIGPGITLSSTADIVGDIANGKGPADMAFCLGYAGWKEGQLEEELVDNNWLVVPASASLLFDVPAKEKYDYCTQLLGLTAVNFSGMVGVA
ncbi:MAG: YqgE/AlgH family protein [Alphaproteobacteria bacterium]